MKAKPRISLLEKFILKRYKGQLATMNFYKAKISCFHSIFGHFRLLYFWAKMLLPTGCKQNFYIDYDIFFGTLYWLATFWKNSKVLVASWCNFKPIRVGMILLQNKLYFWILLTIDDNICADHTFPEWQNLVWNVKTSWYLTNFFINHLIHPSSPMFYS